LLPQSPLARHISTGRHGKQQSNAEGEVMARSEAWRSYAAGSEVRHFAEFAKTHLIQSEDRWEGKPLLLEPWQKRMLGEALAYDERGWPIWRSVTAGRESLSGGALPPLRGGARFLRFGVAVASSAAFRRETQTLPGLPLQLVSPPVQDGFLMVWVEWKEAHQLITGAQPRW
jgi:hypothetical protein